MALKPNINIARSGLSLSNGSVTFEENLNDYPRLTVVEYVQGGAIRPMGSEETFDGMNFFLESINIDTAHINAGLAKQVTYNYVHVAKILYEYPIRVRNFVDKNKGKAKFKRKETYVFQINDLIEFAKAETKSGASISVPAFDVELSKQPSIDETVTVKQYCDSKAAIKARVYDFEKSTLTFKGLGGGGGASARIVSNLTKVENLVPTYRNTSLTWNTGGTAEATANRRLVRLGDSEYCTYEGDHNPHLPPPETADNSKVPRDLSVMIDNSGNTKQFKITKFKFNQPVVELSGVFGYAHAALELVGDPEKPNAAIALALDLVSDKALESGNAYQDLLQSIQSQKFGFPEDAGFENEMVWRLLQIKETKYIYRPLHNTVSPQYKNPDGTLESVQIAPGYEALLNSNIQVLMAEESNGWEIKRFAQEDATNWAEGSISSWLALSAAVSLKDKLLQSTDRQSVQLYNLMLYSAKVGLEQYLYRKVPLYERIDYTLAPYSKYYENADEVNWEVTLMPKNDTSLANGNETEEIPILFPDPDWAPQLMILAKSRYKSSIGLAGNPNYNPLARNYFGSNPVTVTTGSEEYEFTKYSVLPSKNTRDSLGDMYRDYTDISDILTALNSAQNAPGTYYNNHPYMQVDDYGLPNVPLKNLNLNVSSTYPSNRSQQEDIFLTQTTYRNAQDHSYKSNITSSNYSIAQGRPPAATLRKPVLGEEQSEDKTFKDTATLINSGQQNPASQYVTSVNMEAATSLQEALAGAKFELTLNILTSGNSVSGQLSFEQVSQRKLVNSRLNIPGHSGDWIIKRISKTVQFCEGVSFAQPVEFEAGQRAAVSLTSRTVPIAKQDNNQPSVKVRVDTDLAQTYGTPAAQIPPGFSRWLDVS